MHNNWEELIPFYIAGTLSKAEAARLEQHLATCAECRKSLEEWRSISSAVRAEAASQLRDLPPLSDKVRQTVGLRATPQTLVKPKTRSNTASSASATSVTLIAAIFTVILFGGLLTFMVLHGTGRQTASSIAQVSTATSTTEAPTLTPSATLLPTTAPQIIVVVEPSSSPSPYPSRVISTRIPPTLVPPTPAPPTSAPPPTQALQGFTPLVQAPAQTSLAQSCLIHAAVPNSIVNLYAAPGTDAAILTTFSTDDNLTGLGRSDNGWFRAQYPFDNHWIGWVQQELVYTSGNCDNLPLIPVATPTVLPFPNLTPASTPPS